MSEISKQRSALKVAARSAAVLASAAIAGCLSAAAPAQALDTCLGYAAIACTPWDQSVERDALLHVAGRVKHKRQATGLIQVMCPVFDTSDSLNTASWNRLTMIYLDPDGTNAGARVTAALRFVNRAGTVRTVASIDSNQTFPASTDFGEATRVFQHNFNFLENYYYIQASVSRANTTLAPEFGGFQLCEAVN
jgi:hypothetical protein